MINPASSAAYVPAVSPVRPQNQSSQSAGGVDNDGDHDHGAPDLAAPSPNGTGSILNKVA